MNEAGTRQRSPRLQLFLIAAIFLLPLLAATWMYFSGSAPRPSGTTNHGELIDPVVRLPDELDGNPLVEQLADRWAIVYLLDGDCADACRAALYKQRQTRLMLGNDMNRLVRVLLHGSEAPDTLFVEREHAGLLVSGDGPARQLLKDVRPRGMEAEGYYLIDPLGNLVMYFPLDIEPRDLVEDLEHLLKLSRIG